MRWILLGVLLGLLLAHPATLPVVAALVAALLSKPLLVAFGIGVAAGLRTPQLRRWAR